MSAALGGPGRPLTRPAPRVHTSTWIARYRESPLTAERSYVDEAHARLLHCRPRCPEPGVRCRCPERLHKIVPASPWGPNDQTGATNRVTAAVTKAAAAEIQTGKVITMSYPLVDGVPLFGIALHQDHPHRDQRSRRAGRCGENQLTYMEDTWLSQSHVGTHLDGMGHIGRKDCYYNQTAMGKFINQNNMTKLGLEHLKSFATRGVHRRHGQGVPGGRQVQGQLRLQEAVPRQGHRDHGGRHPGRPQDVQRDPARGRHRHHPHRLGRPLRAVSRRRTRSTTAASPASARTRRTGSSSQKVVAVGAGHLGRGGDPGRESRRKRSSSTTCCSPTTASTSSRTCAPT